uniref:Uncharacterized protein n=1 Tax=Catagonus wagneri TaxID=51154 RepID=A0A8C3WXB9_9CETA
KLQVLDFAEKARATQDLPLVKGRLNEYTLQAPSPMALLIKIPTVALNMMELSDTFIEQLYNLFSVKGLVHTF